MDTNTFYYLHTGFTRMGFCLIWVIGVAGCDLNPPPTNVGVNPKYRVEIQSNPTRMREYSYDGRVHRPKTDHHEQRHARGYDPRWIERNYHRPFPERIETYPEYRQRKNRAVRPESVLD